VIIFIYSWSHAAEIKPHFESPVHRMQAAPLRQKQAVDPARGARRNFL